MRTMLVVVETGRCGQGRGKPKVEVESADAIVGNERYT